MTIQASMTIQAFLLAFGCGALVALSTRHLLDSEPDTPCSGAQPAASRAVDWHALSMTGPSPVAGPEPLAARLALLNQLVADMAVDVAPTLHDGVVSIPGHRMALRAPVSGACILPGASYCSSFANAHCADVHVKEAIISVLGGGRCTVGTRRAVAVDLGANVGQFSLFMRAMGCHVIAVEPQPAMNLVHKASLALNGWLDDATVTLHEMATSSAPGSITLTKLWQPGNRSAGTMTATVVTTAEIFAGRTVALLKIDIDGPEIFTLRALVPMLLARKATVGAIVLEATVNSWARENAAPAEVEALFDGFYAAGYCVFLQKADEFSKYPADVMARLPAFERLAALRNVRRVPRSMAPAVLWMANRVTKNFFLTTDPSFCNATSQGVVVHQR